MAVITKTELLTILKDFFENHIPFNVMLGIHVTKAESDVVEIKIRLKPEMIGFEQALLPTFHKSLYTFFRS